MATISTILSRKDADLLEQAIAHHGHLVSTDDLKHVFNGKYRNAELRQQLARLAQRGWLVRIKRGLYVVISDITSLAANNISLLRISSALNNHSYVSLLSPVLLWPRRSVAAIRHGDYQYQNAAITEGFFACFFCGQRVHY